MNVFKLECDKDMFYNNSDKVLYKQLVKSKMLTVNSIYYNIGTEEFLDKYSIISFGEIYMYDEGNIEYDSCYYYSGDNYNLGDIQSDTKIIEKEDIKYFNKDSLNVAYNEIFARHGHDFASKDLKAAFASKLWYLPTYGKTVSLEELNDIEKQNITILKSEIEKKKKYPNGFFELDETTYTVDLGYDWEKYQFSYSDDENEIGGIYTPARKVLTYNEYLADTATSTTKEFFKGKYLHILLKDSKEIYQTIEIKNPFEEIIYNSDTQTVYLGSEYKKYFFDEEEEFYNNRKGDNGYFSNDEIIRSVNKFIDGNSKRLYIWLEKNLDCYTIIDIK